MTTAASPRPKFLTNDWWVAFCAPIWIWFNAGPALKLRRLQANHPSVAYVNEFWEVIGQHNDMVGALISFMRQQQNRYKLLVGINGDNYDPVLGDADSPLLVLGASGTNKSASTIVNNAMLAPGPLAVTSSRRDVFTATALSRSRSGDVWHASAYGRYEPGAKPVRFSILLGCKDYTYAKRVATRWCSYPDMSEAGQRATNRGSSFFIKKGAEWLTPFLFSAAWLGYQPDWVIKVLLSPTLDLSLKAVVKQLQTLKDQGVAGADQAFTQMLAMAQTHGELRDNIINSITNALGAYMDPDVVAAAKGADFDFRAFVRGLPNAVTKLKGLGGEPALDQLGIYPWLVGCYDSLYITEVDAEDPANNVLLDIQDRIREAMYEYSAESDKAGRPRPVPLTWLNDEMAMSPPSKLGQTLAQGRDRGIKSVGVLQSLAQAEQVWGRLGEDFLSLWRSVLLFRGTKDERTNRLVADLSEKFWIETQSTSCRLPA